MSTILFHPSRLVYELGLHNARSLNDALIESGIFENTGDLQTQNVVPDVPRVMLRPAADRRRRAEMRRSA